jgi:hypothetical protein
MTRGGPLVVLLEAWASQPPLDLADWDDVAEAEVTSATGLVELAAPLEGPTPYTPNLVDGPGTFRLRVSVRGREQAFSGSGPEVHRLQCWPAEDSHLAEPVCHQLIDSVGARLRGDVAPPRAQPWQVAGAAAMREFFDAMTSTRPGYERDAVTVTASVAASRRRVFSTLSALKFLVGSGGAGAAVGSQGDSTVYRSDGRQQSLLLTYTGGSFSTPTSLRWNTSWSLRRQGSEHDLPLTVPGQGRLDISLAWSPPKTAITVTQSDIPTACVPSLTALWMYWLALAEERLGSNTVMGNPWSM